MENPTAFITTVHEDVSGETVFKGIPALLKDRMFYDEPHIVTGKQIGRAHV